MTDDVETAVDYISRRLAVYGHDVTRAQIGMPVTHLRALLSERRKMVEAVNLLRRIREGLWIQPQHWNIHDQPRVHELLAEIDAALGDLAGSADK